MTAAQAKAKTTNQLYPLYYGLLAVVLLAQVAYTLYCGGKVVSQSHQYSQYQQQKASLIADKQKLSTQLAAKHSLVINSQNELLANYDQISQPIVVKASASLASLN